MSDKNFITYKASAGSGKTYTLVKEYIALALNYELGSSMAYRHILAITFTNKAAAEMKERIIKTLKELSQEDYTNISIGGKELIIALKKHEKLNLIKQLDDLTKRKRSQNVLSEILHSYSDFAIGTIDSFMHKIVRTFAFDLKIPMNFELEMDADKLLTQAIDLLLAQIGSDETLTKALIEYTESKTDEEKNWRIEKDLKDFAKNLMTEDGNFHLEKLKQLNVEEFFKIKDTIQAEIKTFEAFISNSGKKALKVINDAGIEHSKFPGGANGIGKYFTYLAESRIEKAIPSATIQKHFDSNNWYAGKASAEDKDSIDSIKDALSIIYNDALIYIESNLKEIKLFKLINNNIYSLAVLNEIDKLLNEYKAENNILHISEFNKLIAKIVLNEPVPFIYERLGEKYNNYLIDEFQDTSVLQFQNLLPLIDNSLASGHFTMLVGDGKQAIYRWRGGEVEQFSMLPNVFSHNNNPLVLERERALVRNHLPIELSKNYRSKREIVEFNNSIFRILANKLDLKYKSIYENLEQEFRPENSGGYVQVEFMNSENGDIRIQNLAATYKSIQDLLSQDFQLHDIAILVRKNTDGSEIANYLSNKGIDVISSDSLLLSNSRDVNFIFSLLRYLNNSSEQIIQAELLEYFIETERIKNTDINQLLVERKKTNNSNVKGLYDKHFINIVKDLCVEFDINTLSKMALYELCEELVRLFKLNAAPNAYIQFFLDEVLNYSIKKNNNLNDFIDYWEVKKEKASLIVPNGLNAVTIMTIHRAKGLEFPAVILPFSMGKIKNGKKHLWVELENEKIPQLKAALVSVSEDLKITEFGELYEEEKNKSLLDSLNVLYVALTRPVERMYIFTEKPSKTPANFTSLNDLFAYYYQTIGEWQEGQAIYSFGKETMHIPALRDTKNNNYKLTTFNSNQWRNNIKMRAAAPSIWLLESTEQKKKYGVMVHTALAKIKTVDDVESATNSMYLGGLITLHEKENLLVVINNIIRLPKLKAHFEKNLIVKNEAEIISATGEKFRLDRVVIYPSPTNNIGNLSAVIIDYKTGEEKPSHKSQIIEYASLLAQMGYRVIEKLLVYIEDEKVVEC